MKLGSVVTVCTNFRKGTHRSSFINTANSMGSQEVASVIFTDLQELLDFNRVFHQGFKPFQAYKIMDGKGLGRLIVKKGVYPAV